MRNVKRGPEPESLRRDGVKWTQELLEVIEKSKKDNSDVPDSLYRRYKKQDIKDELCKMYGDEVFNYCCYCESIINDVSYEHIEHRMPMKKTIDKYPERAFDWNNLHLVCELCNKHKSNLFDEKNPILDPTDTEPINEHLSYTLSDTKGVYCETLSKRGITTVKHADLDRASLRMARLKVWNQTIKAIQKIKQQGNEPRTYTAIKMLWDKCSGEHGSLIKHLLNEWGIEDVRENTG